MRHYILKITDKIVNQRYLTMAYSAVEMSLMDAYIGYVKDYPSKLVREHKIPQLEFSQADPPEYFNSRCIVVQIDKKI